MASLLPRLAHSNFKFFAGLLLVLIFFAVLFLYFLPTLITTSWGQEQMTGFLNSRINGKISFKTLDLRWFGVQKIDELTLTDAEGDIIVNIPHAEIDTSLTHWLWNRSATPAKLQLIGMNGKITRLSSGDSNLHRALNIKTTSPLTPAEPFFIQFANMNALLDINPSHEAYEINITGEVQSSGEKGKIELHAFLKNGALPDNLEAKLIHFPVPLIEEVISLFQPKAGHHLSSLLGASVDLELNHSKESQGDRLQLKANTPAWDVDLKGLLTKKSTSLYLDDITGTIHAKKIPSHSSASLSGKISGSLGLENCIENDQLNFKGATVLAKTHLEHFPTAIMTHLLQLDTPNIKKIEALIGSEFSFDGNATLKDLKGPLNFDLLGSHSQIHLESQLHDTLITLNKPLTAELKITPELGQYLLQDLIPILEGIISAENKVTLTIEPQGFSYPIYSHNFHAAEIGSMTLNLGKVYFNNEGQFGKIASLLKAKTQDEISVWFTPIYLNMHNAKIEVKRFDMLVMNKFPLATWGTVDFIKDRIHFIIGLSGKSLEGYLKVPALAEDHMLQVPYKGKIGKASLDKTKLAAQIAALVSSSSGTPQGLGLGALLGLAGGSFNESPPPPPTTEPLPWESGSKK